MTQEVTDNKTLNQIIEQYNPFTFKVTTQSSVWNQEYSDVPEINQNAFDSISKNFQQTHNDAKHHYYFILPIEDKDSNSAGCMKITVSMKIKNDPYNYFGGPIQRIFRCIDNCK